MRIQHNIMAMNAYRNYNNNTKALSKNLERLSSGYKINRAGDDAAGLAISEKMRAQITGLEAAQKNVKDGISLVNTAEGAMQEIHDMLNRMVYLATQSANGTYDDPVDRLNLQKEVDSLKSEINRIADSANFNGIKLLDGEMSSFELSADGVTAGTMSIVDGLTINESIDGGGTKAEATIDLTDLFGTGDTLKLDFTGTGAPGAKTLTFGTDFSGGTLEEQAQSIRDALNNDANISQKFKIEGEGTKITLTAQKEGASEAAVKKVTVSDKTVVFGNKDDANSKPGAAGTSKLTGAAIKEIFGNQTNGNGVELKAGDQLRFTFKGANGEYLVAELTVTEEMIDTTNIENTTKNVVNALKDTYFTDITNENSNDLTGTANKGTVADESRFKVSDFFTVTENNDGSATSFGSIKFEGTKNGAFEADSVKIKRPESDSGAYSAWTSIGTKVAGTAGANATTDPNNIYKTTGGSENFTAGDEITINGVLSDGRTFSTTLVAGKDFTIGSSYDNSATNIKNVLTGNDWTITLNDNQVVNSKDIFAADTSKEIQIATGSGGFTFTSTKKGAVSAGIAGGVLSFTCTAAPKAAADINITKGTDPSEAESSITFGGDKPLNYGTAITVDGETYELVSDPRDVTNRSNHAVHVTDLTDTDAVAEAMAKAINDGAKTKYADQIAEDATKYPPYTATADGSTVKITTKAKGSDVKALEITTPYGTDVPTVSFKFDPAKIQEGSYMTISNADGTNATTYEFVKAGEKAKSGNTAIEISNFNKMPDSKAIADAFANVAKGATVKVADDGTVTLTANESEGSIPALKVSFYEGKGGLKLQIGDTSDDYNQLKVSIGDMHTAAMGIDAINIGTQEGAQAAIDVIRNAINYVSGVRGDLGAISNRLDHTANNLSVMAENIQDAESTIRDTDVAEEMMAYTKNNILVQSAQAMLAQANQVPQGVLQLLQ